MEADKLELNGYIWRLTNKRSRYVFTRNNQSACVNIICCRSVTVMYSVDCCFIEIVYLKLRWFVHLYGVLVLQLSHRAIPGALNPIGVQGSLDNFDQNDPNRVLATISQLSPNTNYSVTLCARTSVGCGNLTLSAGQTDEDGELMLGLRLGLEFVLRLVLRLGLELALELVLRLVLATVYKDIVRLCMVIYYSVHGQTGDDGESH